MALHLKPLNEFEALRCRGAFFVQRFVVVGANGAGKTWLAKALGGVLDLPVIHNDALALTTGWVQRDRDAVQVARDTHAGTDRWVIEGGPSIFAGKVLARAEAIIWLDTPRTVRLRRILWRSVRYFGQQRPEHPLGNRDWPSLRQIRFAIKAWRGDQLTRDTIGGRLDALDVVTVRLASRHDTRCLLDAIVGAKAVAQKS